MKGIAAAIVLMWMTTASAAEIALHVGAERRVRDERAHALLRRLRRAHERFDQLMIGLSPQISTVKFKQVERAMFGISD